MTPVVAKVNESAVIESISMLSAGMNSGEVISAWPAAIVDVATGALNCPAGMAYTVGKAIG